ncbi:transglutaminaseTgpA domain-containing protein [Sporosarcina sp. NPDC096371]|uniref:transglutaminaseTgpA domain-containing protein n=1 Tax=Sporosarcina sp. NPDC096371 TaxID=3364530 RepID=UPI0037F72683
MTGKRIDRRLLVLLYVLGFVLLREWLIPVMELTDTNYLGLFLLFAAISFLMALVGAKWWITAPIKIIYILWVIHYIYLDKVLFSKETILYVFKDFTSNVPIIIGSDWDNITNPLKTVLFFILLWMTTYLIRHWIEVRKSILLFYMMTVIFIATIDTFSPYSAADSIFRIMVSGLLLLGLLFISKLTERHNKPISIGAFVSISLPLLFVVVLSGTFANVLPKQGPVWSDPVPYFKSIVQGNGVGGSGTGIAKSGYDTDDSALGGGFMPDDTVVFEVKVPTRQYWKIETKNTYTSKGWEQVPPSNNQKAFPPGEELGEPERLGKPPRLAEFQVVEPFPFILYPYGLNKVFATSDVLFLHSEMSGKYSTLRGGSEGSLSSYEIEFREPEYSLAALKATRMTDYATENEDFTPYLQLPKELPQRVKELAATITAQKESVYEKTKEIEKYFGKNGFVYTQQDVAIPKSGDDYVDQFLFDTKSGYCDNFSTSMVVMLRALDIPARWVKGFAPGKSILNDEGEWVFQVTNNEAHSWVEAYMPGIGWMPFEPTIGFNGISDVTYDVEVERAEPEVPEVKKPEQPKPEQKKTPTKVEKDFDLGKYFSSVGSWLKKNLWIVVVAITVLVSIAWRLFVVRVKWLPRVLIYANRSGKADWNTFDKQYKSLLKQLDRFGLKRAVGMTLSDYAMTVDDYFGGDGMRKLTTAYEKGLYGGNTIDHEWAVLREVWEDLINRTSG